MTLGIKNTIKYKIKPEPHPTLSLALSCTLSGASSRHVIQWDEIWDKEHDKVQDKARAASGVITDFIVYFSRRLITVHDLMVTLPREDWDHLYDKEHDRAHVACA